MWRNVVDPSRNGIMSGPPFLGGGLILIIRTSNSRVKEECERIKSEHSGVAKLTMVQVPQGCLLLCTYWPVSDGS